MVKEVPYYNIWEYPASVVVIPTNLTLKANGDLVMGAGLALDCKNRFPWIPSQLGAYYESYLRLDDEGKENFNFCSIISAPADTEGKHPGENNFHVRQLYIVSFPTKYNWRDNSNINLIEKSAVGFIGQLKNWNIYNKDLVAVMPRVGCGLGKLKWNVVKPVLDAHLDQRFHVLCPKE